MATNTQSQGEGDGCQDISSKETDAKAEVRVDLQKQPQGQHKPQQTVPCPVAKQPVQQHKQPQGLKPKQQLATQLAALHIDVSHASGAHTLQISPAHLAMIPASDIIKGELLGAADSGKVWRGTWEGHEVAIKEWQHDGATNQSLAKKASNLHSFAHHPNVVNLWGLMKGPTTYALIIEYMRDGALLDALRERSKKQRTRLLFKQLLRVCLEAAYGLEYYHSKHAVHGDITSSNFVCDLSAPDAPRVKLADFGMSRVCQEKGSDAGDGTTQWMAPELFDKGMTPSLQARSNKIDVYAFGIVLWEIMSHCTHLPYHELRNSRRQLSDGQLVQDGLRPSIPTNWRTPVKQLIRDCWSTDPSSRPDMAVVVERLKGLLAGK